MTDYTAIASRYIDAFNTSDPADRAALIAGLFAADVEYRDPLATVSGHDGVNAFIAGAHAQFPGWVFSLAGPVDGHGDQARFTWTLGPETGDAPVQGFDVVTLDGDGRIDRVLGFIDRAPSA
ncbi:SnoaL-like protein [Stackebrandtia albiflava]|uniref:SnoaL-like protein n=1 Tax=Stackebrandtia albiflava TaxID=406432 RepID=A0A562V315_9ACTN|nr:nuclear transport factor 2 family protein [Stackebrandtia albiflava]TWJ12197.1 SnoaL-like protein [Stackebrandtia albiflava]